MPTIEQYKRLLGLSDEDVLKYLESTNENCAKVSIYTKDEDNNE